MLKYIWTDEGKKLPRCWLCSIAPLYQCANQLAVRLNIKTQEVYQYTDLLLLFQAYIVLKRTIRLCQKQA